MKKKYIFILLATVTTFLLNSKHGLTIDFISMQNPKRGSDHTFLFQDNNENIPVIINADYAEGNFLNNNIIFIGNVDIQQGDSHLKANKITLYQKNLENSANTHSMYVIHAFGNVYYKNHSIILDGQEGLVNLNTKDIDILKGNYQLVSQHGHGKSDYIKQRGNNRYTILKNGSFTSCNLNSGIWSIVGKKIIYDRKKQIAKIRHAYLKLGPIPIFYSPYFQFPIGSECRSGFLVPNIKYSTSNYLEFDLPYYWNISSNADATIRPYYLYKHRNIMWKNEFRYLTPATGSGILESNYLSSNHIHKKKYIMTSNRNRWLLYWKHSGVINRVWHVNVNYTKVSDPNYFNDFNSKYGSSTDSYVSQIFSTSYFSPNFNATISNEKFQVFDKELRNYYNAEPQLEINWYYNKLKFLNFHIYGHAIRFVHTWHHIPKSIRLHLEPTINLNWSNNWMSLNTDAKLSTTHYQQSHINEKNNNFNCNVVGSINRILPHFQIKGKMLLERNIHWIKSYTQTLEPSIQYRYSAYRDQKKINNRDSSFFQSRDYRKLFDEYDDSGFDRISSVKNITIGISTWIYDEEAVKRFNFSIGENYYFSEPHASNLINKREENKTNKSILASDMYWNITDYLKLYGGIQYNTRKNNIPVWNGNIEYRQDKNNAIQLNYHYSSQEYMQALLLNYENNNQYRKEISQLGIIANWSINNHLFVTNTYYYDTYEHKLADQIFKLQYNSYCYTTNLSYRRKLNGWDFKTNQSKYDNIVGFNISLHGLNNQ